jgi:hypothetical protein
MPYRERELELINLLESVKRKTIIKKIIYIYDWLNLVIVKKAFSDKKQLFLNKLDTKIKKTYGDRVDIINFLYKRDAVEDTIIKLNEYLKNNEEYKIQKELLLVYNKLIELKNNSNLNERKEIILINMSNTYKIELLHSNRVLPLIFLDDTKSKQNGDSIDKLYYKLKEIGLLDCFLN